MDSSSQSTELSSQELINLEHCVMTQEEMEKLPIPSDVSCKNCVICYSDFDLDTEKLRLLPCSHVFHEKCLFTWLKIHANCPLCRHVLKENTIVTQNQVELWRTYVQNPAYLSLGNILAGTDFFVGPSGNTRSQIASRLN